MERDFDRKLAFSCLLPFGFIGKNAFFVNAKINSFAYLDYDISIPINEREKKCKTTNTTIRNRLGEMKKGNYLDERRYKYGPSDVENFSCFALTPHSLALLSGLLDQKLEEQRIAVASEHNWAKNRNKKEIDYLPSLNLRILLKWLIEYESKQEHTEDERRIYDDLFFDAVSQWDITPLSVSILQSRNVSLQLNGINNRRLHSAYRYGNINTMFRIAGFLSCMDRRPIETGWTFNGLCSTERYQKQLTDGNLDIMSYTRAALEKWYREHPDSYLFHNPGKSFSDNKEQWISTPVFYGLHELPGIKPLVFLDEKNMKATGQQNTLQHSCTGVAIGKNINYIVYHAKQGGMTWRSGVERTSAIQIQEAIDNYSNEQNKSVFGEGRTIGNAIIFCDSIFHFRSLFRPVKNLGNGNRTDKRKRDEEFGHPFTSVSIVPVNGSGVQQLRALLLTDPRAFLEAEIANLCRKDPEFIRVNDFWYPLAYKNRPVLLAYDMDYFRLCRAIADHRAGRDFYICCYPEQHDYLRQILPDAQYL